MKMRIRQRWELLPFAVKAALLVLVQGIAVTATARAVSLDDRPAHSAPAAASSRGVTMTARPTRVFRLVARKVRPTALPRSRTGNGSSRGALASDAVACPDRRGAAPTVASDHRGGLDDAAGAVLGIDDLARLSPVGRGLAGRHAWWLPG